MGDTSVIIIGARSARQGIGAFVAAWLARHGANIAAIIGTTEHSVSLARDALSEHHGIRCRTYTDVMIALEREPNADAVVVCTPHEFHAEHLTAVGRAGRHCLCEKPLIWPRSRDVTGAVDVDPIGLFVAGHKYLQVLTQWPCTLPFFYAAHPDLEGAAIERFEMRLSPISRGIHMVPDAVPHFVSMLQALGGPGRAEDVRTRCPDGDPRRLHLALDYVHGGGRIEAALHLETCTQRPRPAWYAINGGRVDREVKMPEYVQYFRAGARRIAIDDPLSLLTARFLAHVAAKDTTDRAALDQAQDLLTVVYAAARAVTSVQEC